MKEMQYRFKILKDIYPFTIGSRRYFILLSICSLLGMVITLFIPFLYSILIDEVIIGRSLSPLLIVVVGYLALYILGLVLDILTTHFSNSLINYTLLKIRSQIFKNYMNMSFVEYDKFSVGDLRMRIDEDTDKLRIFADHQTSRLVVALTTIIIVVVSLFMISWQLALFSMAIVPITFYLGYIVSKAEARLLEERRVHVAENDSWLHSSLAGWKEVKALNLQRNQFRRYVSNIHRVAINNSKWIMLWTLRVLVIPLIKDEFLMKFSLYFIGGLLIIKGHFTIGTLLIFMRYYTIFYNNINEINNSNLQLKENKPSYDRVIEALALTASKEYIAVASLAGNISLRNVSFSYDNNNNYLIKNLNLDIRRGEKIAIVGKSGSGKTTILKLLLSIIQCQNGSILYDGIGIEEIPPSTLHRKIGVVMQDSILFNMTIEDNLKLVKPNCTTDEITLACKKAGILDFIEALPNKFDTIVGERGIKLSGGQRQRLVIARVFLSDASIIIFDEATSALDASSEGIIHNAINQLAGDKTIIIVAHRLSSVLLCSKIVALKDGIVTGIGSHEELLINNPYYNELFGQQNNIA